MPVIGRTGSTSGDRRRSRARADLGVDRRLRRARARAAADRAPSRLDQPALLAAAALARRRARAARDHRGRPGDRRRRLPARRRARRRRRLRDRVGVPIGRHQTAGHCSRRSRSPGPTLLAGVVDDARRRHRRSRRRRPARSTLAPKLTLDDARIDWTQPTRGGRRADPRRHPRAGRLHRGRRRAAQGARRPSAHDAPRARPGRRRAARAGACVVGTGDRAVELLRVQPAGKHRDGAPPTGGAGATVRGIDDDRPARPRRTAGAARAPRRLRGARGGARRRRLREPAAARPHRPRRGSAPPTPRSRPSSATAPCACGLLRPRHRARRGSPGRSTIDPPVLDVLRLGAHQLLADAGADPRRGRRVGRARRTAGSRSARGLRQRGAAHHLPHDARGMARARRARDPGRRRAKLAAEYSHPDWIVARAPRRPRCRGARRRARGAARRRQHRAAGEPRGASRARDGPGPGDLGDAERVLAAAASRRGIRSRSSRSRSGRVRVQDEGSQLAALALSRARPVVAGGALARPLRRPGRQGRAARGRGARGRGGARRERARARHVPSSCATRSPVFDSTSRCTRSTVASSTPRRSAPRRVRPHPARRAVHRARRAAPPARGALAQAAGRRRRARRTCRPSCSTRAVRALEARAASSPTSPARRTSPRPGDACARRSRGTPASCRSSTPGRRSTRYRGIRSTSPAAASTRAALAAPARHRRDVHPAARAGRVTRVRRRSVGWRHDAADQPEHPLRRLREPRGRARAHRAAPTPCTST